MPGSRGLTLLPVTVFLALALKAVTFASDIAPQPTGAAPLAQDVVIDNLVRQNEERARALRCAEATRVYHLVYRGFPGDREAEMTVRAVYTSPSTKDFEVISQGGSKLLADRVFTKLLEGEKEAAEPEMRDRTLLNRENYEFSFVRFERASQGGQAAGGQYVFEVTPKAKSKFVYRGKIWVDATDFAVTRIDAEPAQNPSFWTKRNEIHHEYAKVQGFWLPVRNESTSYVRLGGRATLTIEYKDYKVSVASISMAVSAVVGSKE
jgi:hypothetical protein